MESQTELPVFEFLVETGLQSAHRLMPIEPFKNRLENVLALASLLDGIHQGLQKKLQFEMRFRRLLSRP